MTTRSAECLPRLHFTHGVGMSEVNGEQGALVAAFVNAHRAYEAHRSRMDDRAQSLFDQRQEALRVATEAGVSGAVLAAESDMSAGRISQLRSRLGLSKPRERAEA